MRERGGEKSEAQRIAWRSRSLQLASCISELLIQHGQPGPWTCWGQEEELRNLREPGQAGEEPQRPVPRPQAQKTAELACPKAGAPSHRAHQLPQSSGGMWHLGLRTRLETTSSGRGIYLGHLLSLGPHFLTIKQGEYHQTKWGVGTTS